VDIEFVVIIGGYLHKPALKILTIS
jgi:hypothetical protein